MNRSVQFALVVGLTVASPALVGRVEAQGTGDTSGLSPAGGGGSLMGNAPGAGGGTHSSSGNSPLSGQIIGNRPGASTPKGIPTSMASPSNLGPTILQEPIKAPDLQPLSPASAPLYGTLDIPAPGTDDDGPADGVNLDRAIALTLERSLDLRSKFYEIPQARADVLQAGLRANPIFYADTQLVPYQSYSRARPGGQTQYDVNVTYPFDVSHKRQARTEVACRAVRVLEAQYQDAVRQRIDDVYDAFVLGTLASRQTLRYARQSTQALTGLVTKTEDLYRGGSVSRGDYNRVKIQLRTARLGLVDAEAAYRKAKLDLGSLMNLSPEEVARMEIRGSIEDNAPAPPPVEELTRIALEERPDILSYRLGVKRAQADVTLAQANRLSDVFLLYQPYSFQDNSPFGTKSATSWAMGITAPMPIYNRNQGAIQRARLNVDQTRIELSEVERQAVVDVAKAAEEYAVTRREVKELREEVIPEAIQIRDQAFRLYVSGEQSAGDYINAQIDFNTVAKQYLDTAIRHRRSMLNLNTVTGRRIMP